MAVHADYVPGNYGQLVKRFLRVCASELGTHGRKLSPYTLRNYEAWLAQFGDWLRSREHTCMVEEIRQSDVKAFFASRMQAGRKPSSMAAYYAALKRFFGWLADEPEIDDGWRNPMQGVKKPRVPIEPPEVLDIEQVRRLIRACAGKRFEDLRDTAMLRILFDAGLRRGELAGLSVADANAALSIGRKVGRLTVTGKTGTHEVDLSGKTQTALERYLAIRARHPQRHAKVLDRDGNVHGEALWLGTRGALHGDTIRRILKERAAAAGIEHWWTHMMRHTSVHIQLEAGAREHHLMRTMGWTSTTMLERYAARQAVERALDEHRSMAIGDLI